VARPVAKFDLRIVAAVAVLGAAAIFAIAGPTADRDHLAGGDTGAYGSDNEGAAAPMLATPDGWLAGNDLTPPAARQCPTTAIDALGADDTVVRSYNATSGGTATVYLSAGGDARAVIDRIATDAANCGVQQIDGANISVVGVHRLVGADAVEIRYGTDLPDAPEIVSVWIADGDRLVGATGSGVDDISWANMLDALFAAANGGTEPGEWDLGAS
jgi:hypothetical protein